MKRLKECKKILHITHTDLDGISCKCLSEMFLPRIFFGTDPTSEELFLNHEMVGYRIEFILCEPQQLAAKITELGETLKDWDMVIITDLNITQAVVDAIESTGDVMKFVLCDHHMTSATIDNLRTPEYIIPQCTIYDNNYLIPTCVDSWRNYFYEERSTLAYTLQVCGTTLYASWLLNESGIELSHREKVSLFHFCQTVRMYDTYTFNDDNDSKAYHLNRLFQMVGKDIFSDYAYAYLHGGIRPDCLCENCELKYNGRYSKKRLRNTVGPIASGISTMVDIEMRRDTKDVDRMTRAAHHLLYTGNACPDGDAWHIAVIPGCNRGPAVASKFRELQRLILDDGVDAIDGTHEFKELVKQVDFVMCLDAKSVSLYTVSGRIHLNEVASKLGGGGHVGAAGFPINGRRLYSALGSICLDGADERFIFL